MSIVQRLHASVTTRAVDRENLTVDIVASTPSVDSYGTIIDQKGWDVEQFKRNPVITWAHDDRGFTASEGLPVANAIPNSIRVENGELKMRLRFTPEDVHPFGYRVFRMISEGFLHGLSVGFDPQADEMTDDGSGGKVRCYTRCKLLETAVVTIPSNDDALVQRARQLNREGDVEKIRQEAKELEAMAQEQKPVKDIPVEEVKAEEPKPEPIEPTLPEAIHDVAQKMTADYVQKCISYFEKKQPANKAATRVLKKFYQIRGDEPPADEVSAWKGIEEKLEEVVAVVKVEEVAAEAKAEEVKVEAPVVETPAVDTPAPEAPAVVTPEAPAAEVSATEVAPAVEVTPVETPTVTDTSSTTVPDVTPPVAAPDSITTPVQSVEEAPPPARKAYVQLPLPVLLKLRSGQKAAVREAAAEALRQGVPLKRLVGMFQSLEV